MLDTVHRKERRTRRRAQSTFQFTQPHYMIVNIIKMTPLFIIVIVTTRSKRCHWVGKKSAESRLDKGEWDKLFLLHFVMREATRENCVTLYDSIVAKEDELCIFYMLYSTERRDVNYTLRSYILNFKRDWTYICQNSFYSAVTIMILILFKIYLTTETNYGPFLSFEIPRSVMLLYVLFSIARCSRSAV